MADLNDFLNKLGIGNTRPQVENSPLDLSRLSNQGAALQAPLEQPIKPVAAPQPPVQAEQMAPEPPQEDEEIQLGPPSVGPADLETEIQMAAQDSGIDLSQPDVPETPVSPLQQKQSLLEKYRQAQQGHQDNLSNLALLQGGNQIAQGFARGFGSNIDDGSSSIKALKDASESKVKGLEGEADFTKKATALDEEAKMADPKSDVSEFYRQQAYAMLKKLKPDQDFEGQLDNMSAAQLQKIPGMKNMFSQGVEKAVGYGAFINAKNNHPLHFDQATKKVVDSITGEVVGNDTQVVRPVAYNDPLTGNRGYFTQDGMSTPGSGQLSNTDKTGAPKKVIFADFKRAAPKLADDFQAVSKELRNDMKDSREVATSVTNLASKLKPGPNGEVDSGLLGGIQTQAAKMAGQKGVLTDQDLVKFSGAGGVPAQLERIANGSMFGEMTESDIKFFKRFAELMGKSLNQDVENRAQVFVDQAKQQVQVQFPDVSDQDIRQWLSVDKMAPVVQDGAGLTSKDKLPPVPKGMVRFKDSQGKTHDIPEASLEAAKKRDPGLKVMK